MTHTVYPHEQVYGQYCTIQAHIDCPPEKVFAYMANPYSLLEWTYSVRELRPTSNARISTSASTRARRPSTARPSATRRR